MRVTKSSHRHSISLDQPGPLPASPGAILEPDAPLYEDDALLRQLPLPCLSAGCDPPQRYSASEAEGFDGHPADRLKSQYVESKPLFVVSGGPYQNPGDRQFEVPLTFPGSRLERHLPSVFAERRRPCPPIGHLTARLLPSKCTSHRKSDTPDTLLRQNNPPRKVDCANEN
jgi:hypothetical protein